MAAIDVAVSDILINKFSCFTVLLLVAVCYIVKKYYNTLYAYVLSKFDQKLSRSKQVTGLKQTLFSSMLPAKAIVEIGAGSGTNFQFYPNQCALRCVEPKVEFKGYVDDSLKKRGEHLASVEFVQGTGELLSQIESIKPGSVDYVVCTLVLCSVKDVSKVIQEVKTVLKPVSCTFFWVSLLQLRFSCIHSILCCIYQYYLLIQLFKMNIMNSQNQL